MTTVTESIALTRLPNQTSRLWSVMPMAAVLVASAGVGFGKPYLSNQNTYLLHAVGPSLSSLRDDWVLHTTDPFPAFTAVARLANGRVGFAVESYALAVAAFTGLYLIASTLLRTAPRVVQRVVPSLAVLSFIPACYLIPHALVPALSWWHPFSGLGGQYLMSMPSMFQASDCGALLLLSAGIAVWAVTSRPRRPLWCVAAGLAVATCVLHPTYLAPFAIALLGFAIADVAISRTPRRFAWYAGAGFAAVTAVVATNPVVRNSLSDNDDQTQRYLAFERIPHHTLVSQWDFHDAFLPILILAGAGLTVVLTRAWWAATMLTVCLTVAGAAVLIVEVTRSAALAMMFPWRITVCLVPVATLTAVVWLLRLIAERLTNASAVLLPVAACLSLICVGVGTFLTVRAPDPASDLAVQAVRVAQPSGVGLIPLEERNVRLNAPAAVYVDWKSHPYLSADLVEWQRRIAAVEAAATDDGVFCRLIQQERITWVMLRPDRRVPACIVGWRHAGFEGVPMYLRRH
jgi:Domain of unknown function (DUF6798)